MKKFIYCFVAFILLSACSNDLSRGEAEDMIRAKYPVKTVGFLYNPYNGLMPLDLNKAQSIQLVNDGYVLKNGFTEKAKPYLTKTKGDGSVFYSLQVGKVDKVVVSSISKPADLFGHKFCKAKYEIKYKPNALGKKLKLEMRESSDTESFILTDNGWEFGNL